MGNDIPHGVLPATRSLASLAACFLAVAGVLLALSWFGFVGIEFFALVFASAILIAGFPILPGGVMQKEIEQQQQILCTPLNSPKQADRKDHCSTPAAPPPRNPPAI